MGWLADRLLEPYPRKRYVGDAGLLALCQMRLQALELRSQSGAITAATRVLPFRERTKHEPSRRHCDNDEGKNCLKLG